MRNLGDDLIARLKRRVARHGHSAEAEHREILAQALSCETEPDFLTLAAEVRKLTDASIQTSSEVLMREGRAEQRYFSSSTRASRSNGWSPKPARIWRLRS